MGDHPTYEQLEAFLAGDLPRNEGGVLLVHLSARCPECRRRLVRLTARTLGLLPAAVPPAAGFYDSAVERAFTVARRRARGVASDRRNLARDLTALLAAADPRQALQGFAARPGGWGGGWVLAEELLALSRELRYRDPASMVRFADLARLVVSTLDPERYGAEPVADLEARTYAELANAYRVSDHLGEAERAMAKAEARRREGTGDLLLAARILDLTASLRSTQRRFSEALGLLGRAHALYRELGEHHLAGRTLVSRGMYTGYGGDPEAALGFLRDGMALLEPGRDPQLTAAAEQLTAWFLADAGRFAEAGERLGRGELRHAVAGDPLSLVKLGWLEGRIAQGLGDPATAEAAFVATRGAFLAAGQAYNAALVALDLAALWLAAGRTAELRPLVEELVGTFRALGIGREALAALLLLEQACERDWATLDLVREVFRFLHRFQHDPSLTFGLRMPGMPG
jgi:tetratricopeptide (TPR) repeat protein